MILFQEWRNVESLYAWVGKDLDSPHLFGGDDGHIADFRITHYESLDVEPVWFDASSTNGTGAIGAPLGELPEETPR